MRFRIESAADKAQRTLSVLSSGGKERELRTAPQIAASNKGRDEPHRSDEVVLSSTLRLRSFGGRVGEVE